MLQYPQKGSNNCCSKGLLEVMFLEQEATVKSLSKYSGSSWSDNQTLNSNDSKCKFKNVCVIKKCGLEQIK